MPGGAYSALSGMRTRLEELDRLAADLANVSTVGYKTERAAKVASERDAFATALESAVDVVMGGKKIDFKPGLIASTGRDLDVAIDGSGFFAIETPAGERYTRNGSFSRRADGTLTTSTGETVLGESGAITLPNGPVRIGGDGTITSGTTVVGRLQIVQFASESDLIRESGAIFRALTGATPEPAEVRLVPGSIEQSNVNMVDRMAKLTELTRNFESLNKGVTTLMNDLDGRAISALGTK
ncbi:MAG TPA: flagellar basal-body rod protein FlgF [Vicinamibacterales bacterium]